MCHYHTVKMVADNARNGKF